MKHSEKGFRIAVVGSAAGFISWAVGAFIPMFLVLTSPNAWVAELLDASIIGACVGFFGSFVVRSRQLEVDVRKALSDGLWGAGAGALGFAISILPRTAWLPGRPATGIIVAWASTGTCLGLRLGYLRHGRQLGNVLLAGLGGSVGAAVGGVILVRYGTAVEYVTRAGGLMLTGSATCLCAEYLVWFASRATLRYVYSSNPVVDQALSGGEWILLRRSHVLFARSAREQKASAMILIPDRSVAPLHALLEGRKDGFFLWAHKDNLGPGGLPVWRTAGGNPPMKLGPHEQRRLEHGDTIEIGEVRFHFDMAHAGVAVRLVESAAKAAILALVILLPLVAAAQPRLSLAAGPKLMRLKSTAEEPAFYAEFNILNADGRIAPVPVSGLTKSKTAFRVTEDGKPLRVCSISMGTQPQRLAILLVDVSGTMGEQISGGPTKFEVAQSACRRFAGSFEPGIDHIAVIPFDSHGVVDGIRNSRFAERVEDFEQAVKNLPRPSNGNTGLYTAVIEARTRLREEAKNYPQGSVRTLLAVLTDGRNDVRRRDDKGLERRVEHVIDTADAVGIQTITVGFGTPDNLDEEALRLIAWPSRSNYFRAVNPDQVVRAFEEARTFQVERLTVLFQPPQKRISQLVSTHHFAVSFQDMTTELAWSPRAVNVAEGMVNACRVPEDRSWTSFVWVLFAGILLHWFAWGPLPRRVWGGWHDREVSRKRVETSWPH